MYLPHALDARGSRDGLVFLDFKINLVKVYAYSYRVIIVSIFTYH